MNITTRPVALAAGILFAATAAIDIPHIQNQPFTSPLDYLLEASFALSLAAGAAALFLLARRERALPARIAWAVTGVGMTLAMLSAAATFVAGRNMLGPAFALALPLIVIGEVTLAVLDVRRRVSPRFAGLAMAVGTVAMFVLGDGFGLLAWSAAWFAVAALLQPTDVPAREPATA